MQHQKQGKLSYFAAGDWAEGKTKKIMAWKQVLSYLSQASTFPPFGKDTPKPKPRISELFTQMDLTI